MSREDAKRETRSALIEAGLELFLEQGVDQPSLDAICAHAGYTRGAFYVHFADRDDFIFECINQLLDAFNRAIIANTNAAGDLETTVDRFLDVAISGSLPLTKAAPGGGLVHFLATTLRRSPELRRRYAKLLENALDGVSAAVTAGQDGGTVRDDVTPRTAALVFVSSAIGLGFLMGVEVDVDLEDLRGLAHRVVKPPDA